MAPDLFAINWDTLGEALILAVVLSLLVERALSVVFENRKFIDAFDNSNVKEGIAFAVALGIVWYWGFDLLSILFIAEENTWLGLALTALIIAGGSKGSIKLFHDVLGVKSSARKEKDGA